MVKHLCRTLSLIEVHLAALKWNTQQRRFGLVAEDCKKLQSMSVEFLELLKSNMLDKAVRCQVGTSRRHTAFCTRHNCLLFIIIYICYITNYITGQRNHSVWLKWKLQHSRARILPHWILQDHCWLHLQHGYILRWHVRAAHLQFLLSLESDLDED